MRNVGRLFRHAGGMLLFGCLVAAGALGQEADSSIHVTASPHRNIFRLGAFHNDPQGGNDCHESASDVWRTDQAGNSLVAHEHAEHEQNGAVGLSAEHLRPPHPVGQASARRTLHKSNDHQREHERSGIGQHVSRVGQQRQ